MKKVVAFAPFLGLFIVICIVVICTASTSSSAESIIVSVNLSDEVLAYDGVVSRYCGEYGISEYKPWLMAIMMVESEGGGNNVMGVADLDNSTTTPDESIKEGCRIFSECLQKSQDMGCNIETTVQAYNYGADFVNYVSDRGKNYTFELAKEYANEKSDGQMISYNNHIADAYGGWKYVYGNMFYVLLCKQYVSNSSGSDIAQFALQFVGEGHSRFTHYESPNSQAFEADWCAMFVSYCADQCGYIDSGKLFWFNGCTTAYNRMLVDDTFEYSSAYGGSYVPRPGDLIFFTNDSGNSSYHVGIVVGINGTWLSTVEGNASGGHWSVSTVCYKEDRYDIASSGILGYFSMS